MSSPEQSSDDYWMGRALELARQGEGLVEPNPMVGCVLVRDGEMIGQGYHGRYGGPHAEVEALRDCEDPSGATAYVTLEPCCHFGKTPPCVNALIAAKIARVVVAAIDPFEKVSGGGVSQLRDAGIDVVTGICQSAATEILAPYLKRVRTGCPWVIAKWAMSLDGRIATATGDSRWITGTEARREVHRLRRRVDAIMVGMGTVRKDDPQLTVRGLEDQVNDSPHRTPVRLVVCRSSVPELNRQLVVTAAHVPTWLIAGPEIKDSELARLADHDVQAWQVDQTDPVAMIEPILRYLGGSSNLGGFPMTNLMVEGGAALLGSFFAAGHIDEAHVYVGSPMIGGSNAMGPIGDPGAQQLSAATRMKLVDMNRLGDDVRLVYRKSTVHGLE